MSRFMTAMPGNDCATSARDYRTGDPMVTPDRSGEIHAQFKRLNELIRLNAELIGGLTGRLACVMPPQPPAGINDCGAQPHASVSPFADELRSLSGRVDAANCDLQRIMERLEL